MDGKGQLPHLDMLLAIEKLRGIQWIPGAGQPEAADWPDVLDKIRKSGKLCQVYSSPEGALKIVREHGGKGFSFVIHHERPITQPCPTEEWYADFLAELKRHDISRRKNSTQKLSYAKTCCPETMSNLSKGSSCP